MTDTLIAMWAGEINQAASVIKSMAFCDLTAERMQVILSQLHTLRANSDAIKKQIDEISKVQA